MVLLVLSLVNASGARAEKVNKFDAQFSDKTLPGHGVYGACSLYASELVDAMRSKGVKAAWVAIKWQGSDVGHSFVIFQKDGKTFAIDNMMAKPVRVSGKTDLAVAKKLFALRSPLPVERVCYPMFGTKSNAGVSDLATILN